MHLLLHLWLPQFLLITDIPRVLIVIEIVFRALVGNVTAIKLVTDFGVKHCGTELLVLKRAWLLAGEVGLVVIG